MRSLIYVPIIHSHADLGSLAAAVNTQGVLRLGDEYWLKHKQIVDGLWASIRNYFAYIDVTGYLIYQDGMVTDGELGQQIVEDGKQAGSKNFELLAQLIDRGAILARTENLRIIKAERDRLVAIIETKSTSKKIIAVLKYKLFKNILLRKRDAYIANKIENTLGYNKHAILFIGADHNVKSKLPQDIQIFELKDTRKIRDYQRLLQLPAKHTQKLKRLEHYLVSEIAP